MADKKLEEPFTKRKAPLPNILKIETLTMEELQMYSSITGDLALSARKDIRKMVQSTNLTKKHTFYGFLTNDKLEFGLSNKWDPSTSSGIISQTLGKVTGIKAFETLSGLIGQGKESAGFIGGSILKDLAGIDYTSFGPASRKTYNGTTLHFPESVSCGWYIPQAFGQARLGIKTLMDILYPTSIGRDKFKSALEGSTAQDKQDRDKLESELTAKKNRLNAERSRNNNVDKNAIETLTQEINELTDKIKQLEGSSSVRQKVAETFDTFVGDFLGTSLTFEPIPVRVYIGSKVIMEPMVIEKCTFNMSAESFYANVKVSEPYGSGKKPILLPEFITVSFTFDYWIQPESIKNRLNIMGMNMFTKESKVTTSDGTGKLSEENNGSMGFVSYDKDEMAKDGMFKL